MPRQTPQDPNEMPVCESPLKIRIYVDDHEKATAIQSLGQQVIRNLTLNEILREAIHAGLPLVIRKYQAMVTVAHNTK